GQSLVEVRCQVLRRQRPVVSHRVRPAAAAAAAPAAALPASTLPAAALPATALPTATQPSATHGLLPCSTIDDQDELSARSRRRQPRFWWVFRPPNAHNSPGAASKITFRISFCQ